VNTTPSSNLAFLPLHDPRLVALGTQAEEHFASDATIALFNLRQFREVLAKRAAAKAGLADALEALQKSITECSPQPCEIQIYERRD